MAFKMPENLGELTLEQVSKLHEEALAEATELNKIADDKITDEQTARLIEIVGHMGQIEARQGELETEVAQRAEALAAARAKLTEEPAEEPAAEDEVPADEEPAEEPADAEANVEEKEPVMASGAPKTNFAAKVGAKAPKPAPRQEVDPQAELKSKAVSIVASANMGSIVAGAELADFSALATAYAARTRSFALGGRGGRKDLPTSYDGHQLSDSATRLSVAQLVKPDTEFTITEKMSAEDQYDLIMRAASESRLPGGSLVAAGGWCAPSEQVYGFLELESADGLLSIPEMIWRRGGISWTRGPQLGDLLLEAQLGWTYTEAQVEAGVTKPIFDIECPDWDEIRLDVTGFAIRAGLLTSTAYPELIRRYLNLGTIVHARRMNALTIARLSTLVGAATTFTPVGAQPSFTADLLSAIELNAIRVREQYSMPINSTLEAIFPIWALAMVRSDLSRRLGGGTETINVSDQMITQWFRDRKVNAQFVRDYQAIGGGAANTVGGTAGWTRFPGDVEFMLYPAGSFVRGGSPVIDLDAVYDTDQLTQNQYLAAFFEEGFAVANTGASGVKVRVGAANLFGSTGYPSIGALANVAPTP